MGVGNKGSEKLGVQWTTGGYSEMHLAETWYAGWDVITQK